jgi:hypothetical protein
MAKIFEVNRGTTRSQKNGVHRSLLAVKVQFALRAAFAESDVAKRRVASGTTHESAALPYGLVCGRAASRRAVLVAWEAAAASFTQPIKTCGT